MQFRICLSDRRNITRYTRSEWIAPELPAIQIKRNSSEFIYVVCIYETNLLKT